MAHIQCKAQKAYQVLDAEAEGLVESGVVSTEPRPGLPPFPTHRERPSGDREMPGKVNSLVMEVTFSKSKFVTCRLSGDLSTGGKMLEGKASSESLAPTVAILIREEVLGFFHI